MPDDDNPTDDTAQPGQNQETTMSYTSVVFMQDDDAHEVLDIIDTHSTASALEHLKQWDYGDNYEAPRDDAPWGSRDHVERFPYGDGVRTYVLAWNNGLTYVSLTIDNN